MVNVRERLKDLFLKNVEESESKDLVSKFEFMIKGSTILKKVVAYIASNTIVKHAIIFLEDSKVSLFYESQIEQIITEIFYHDMALERFEYLPLVIDVIGQEQLRDICLKKDMYLKSIQSVIAKQEEYKSCLLNRVLEKQLSVI